MMNGRSWILLAVAAATALLTAGPEAAWAQVATPGAPMASARDRIAESVAVDSFLALVPDRDDEEIGADVERSFRQERDGSEMKSRAERSRAHVLALREVQEKEIERVKRETDIARELGEDNRRKLLEDERKLRERYRDLLGDRAEALKRAVELGDQQVRHARAVRKSLDEERKVAEDRREWVRLMAPEVADRPGAANVRSALEKSILERVKKYFQAVRQEADEAGKLADRRRAHADQLVDVMERRRKLLDG